MENDIKLSPENEIVVVEGNYLLLTVKEQCDEDLYWHELGTKKIFDVLFYVSYDDESMIVQRLVDRHMRVWNISQDDALSRVLSSDILNTRLIDAPGMLM